LSNLQHRLGWENDEEEDTCVSYEEEDTCVSYAEEDTCVPYDRTFFVEFATPTRHKRI
jgi:hypothetical protein